MATRVKSCVVCVLAAASVTWGVLAHPVMLRGSEWSADLARLFDLGAKSTPPAVTAARTQYEKLKRDKPKDARIDYAYALVLAGQHRYRDALPLVSRYLERAPADSDAVRVRIWLQIQDRRYPDMMTDAVALSERFAKNPAGETDDSLQDTAHFLGAVFGYLELARPGSIDRELKSKSKNQILARLGDRYTPMFDEGRNAVADQLGQMQAERDAKQQQVAAAAEKRQQQDKAALQEDKSKIAEREEKIESSTEQLRDAQHSLSVIQQQLASLGQDRTQLAARIITIQAQLASLNIVTTRTIDARLPQNTGPTVASDVVNISASPEDFARAEALARSLAVLNKQAFDMDRKILGLRTRAAQLNSTGEQEIETIAQSDADARKAGKRAKAFEKKIRREEASFRPRGAVLTAKMTSLATYAPFPYEQEKERVLGWFSK